MTPCIHLEQNCVPYTRVPLLRRFIIFGLVNVLEHQLIAWLQLIEVEDTVGMGNKKLFAALGAA